jgi:hypothetical protein
MNQLYLLNHKRVLATRYKILKKSSLLLFACDCVCKMRIRISVINFLRAAIKYAISFFMYYILYFVCICVFFFHFSFCVYFLNLQNNNVYVCHYVVMFYFFFSSSARSAYYIAAHRHVVLFLLLFFSLLFLFRQNINDDQLKYEIE